MRKKGFTLIELLAVILILAIIAAILTPVVRNIIDSSKEQADKRSAERYIRAAQEYYVEAEMDADKRANLGTNIINKLDLENVRATGTVVAYPDGTTEMAIIINSRCFTKSTTQDLIDIEVSKDLSNCKVVSSKASISKIESGDNYIAITTDDNGEGISISSCKYGVSAGNYDNDGTISGSVCTLNNTEAGKRYYYEIVFSDGSKRTGNVQSNPGETITPSGGGSGSYAGGSGSGGSGGGTGVAAPVLTEANGRTIYTGRMLPQAEIKYFNVTTGEKCNIVDFSSNGGGNDVMTSGCLKFYAYMEDNLSYTMILDRNIIRYAKWGNNNMNSAGPKDIITTLKEMTDSWTGTITPKNYVNVFMNNGSELAYGVPYETNDMKARLITMDEVARITGNTSFSSVSTGTGGWFYLDGGTSASTGQTWQTQIATASEPSAYAWLFNYTRCDSRCNGYGCTAETSQSSYCGYWTSDAIAGTTNSAWIVQWNGAVGYGHNSYAISAGITDQYYVYGIRPVITVLKSKLQ